MSRSLAAVVLAISCMAPGVVSASDSTSAASAASPEPQTRKLPGGAVLRIAPGTQFTVGHPIKVQLGSRPERTLAQTIRLVSGRVEVDLPASKTPTTAVLVQGPSRISAVTKGGHSVVIAGSKHVTVAAVSGEMLVASGNDWRTLPSGIVRDFQNGSGTDHAVLPAPQAKVSSPVALSVSDGPKGSPLEAAATPIARAAAYEFGLWKIAGSDRQLLKRLRSKGTSVELGHLAPGSYGITAHATEASGLEGAESELVPVRVVSAQLPEGAKLTDGGILLTPTQRIKLVGTEGVEVSYGRAPQFVPAPNTIGLIRGEPTLVRLRARGSKDELALTLAPRTLHADVQLGPARAHWPQDRVAVSVRLTDSRGRAVKSDVVAKAKVFVNVTPVQVDWKREGNLMTGTVPSGTGAGPWVVRVEIADDTGSVVGRDFLEIAPGRLAQAK
jgi:hypothetical protein